MLTTNKLVHFAKILVLSGNNWFVQYKLHSFLCHIMYCDFILLSVLSEIRCTVIYTKKIGLKLGYPTCCVKMYGECCLMFLSKDFSTS